MDVVYVVQHGQQDDLELRFSLRSVARHLPWIRKVWVFGPRPAFLSDDCSVIEHVPWDSVAWTGRFKTPVQNSFLQAFLVSLWPDLDFEFLVFTGDYLLLDRFSEPLARRDRYVENLDEVPSRDADPRKQSLWYTYEKLKQLGFTGYNFETHTPTYLSKIRVFDAYADLEGFVTEDRFAGMLAEMAILNHAYRQQRFPLTLLSEENLFAGFHDQPATYSDIVAKAERKLLLNFDDQCFNDDMRRFLSERFPQPCLYEAQ